MQQLKISTIEFTRVTPAQTTSYPISSFSRRGLQPARVLEKRHVEAAFVPVISTLLATLPSRADEIASEEVAPVLVSGTDPVISILFGVASVFLTIVTLGVGYLSLTSWLDSRREEEDRVRAKSTPRAVPTISKEPKKAKQSTESTNKGFGKK